MVKQHGWANVILMVMIAAAVGLVLVSPMVLSKDGFLFDRQATIAATTVCTRNGFALKAFGTGYTTPARTDHECEQREAARLMALTGMHVQARIEECSLASSLRNFATVRNCLNADTIPYAEIERDVLAKQAACGGPKIKLRKQRKYNRCMAAR